MAATMPRLTASSASSRAVQWLTGRSPSGGGSQASATIRTTCSAVKAPGAPDRGASASRSASRALRRWSSSPAASAAISRGASARQRARQPRTVLRSRPSWRAISSLFCSPVAASTPRTRRTNRCGLVWRRASRSRSPRSRSLTTTGEGLGPRIAIPPGHDRASRRLPTLYQKPLGNLCQRVLVADVAPALAALRRSLHRGLLAEEPQEAPPGVLILDDDLRLRAQTPAARDWLSALAPAGAGPQLPTAVYAVAARLLG